MKMRNLILTSVGLFTAPLYAFAAGHVVATPVSVTITVHAGARQTFRGLGASVSPWVPSAIYNAQVTQAQTKFMARLLWHDARFRSVRLWMHPGQPIGNYVDGWVATHKLPDVIAEGATDLILAPNEIPPAMGDGHGLIRDDAIAAYATLLAQFIRDFKDKTGILINHCGVLNEPNDRPVKFSDSQWPVVIKDLRQALDARGLKQVGIVAPESANCGGDAYAVVDSLKADPAAWKDLQGVATHSYNNAATEEMAIRSIGKQYWVTEAGGITDADEGPGDALQAASIASRFLNDVNHGVTNWQFFIGFEQADPAGNTGRILKYDVSPFHLTILQKYWSLKQLSEAFDVGARFRHSLSSLDGEMIYTYGKKPRVYAAVAQNPDGTWAIGVSNYTSPLFQDADDPANSAIHNSGYVARTFAVTLRVPELARIATLHFAVHRSNVGSDDMRDGTLVMHRGVITVPRLGPLDLITLRSIGKTPGSASVTTPIDEKMRSAQSGRHKTFR